MNSFLGSFSTVQVLPESLLSADGLQSVYSSNSNWSTDHLLGTTGKHFVVIK